MSELIKVPPVVCYEVLECVGCAAPAVLLRNDNLYCDRCDDETEDLICSVCRKCWPPFCEDGLNGYRDMICAKCRALNEIRLEQAANLIGETYGYELPVQGDVDGQLKMEVE